MLTMKARSIASAVFLGAGALAVVLYGMWAMRVHEPMKPPASLARLAPVEKVGPVPAVAFLGADGRTHALKDFKGRYVLLNLWAVWCAPCVKELPALAKLQSALPPGQMEVVAVDVARGTPKDAADFLKSHNAVALKPYIDPNLTLMRAFGAYGLPMTILIDDKGNQIAHAMGPADWDAADAIAYFKALSAKARS
jgi:thiol-disulfide isomerase/thioredoxin